MSPIAKCPRCDGRMMLEGDRGWVCTMCGEEREARAVQVQVQAGDTQPDDWLKAARAAGRALLAEVAAVDKAKTEAEMIWRVLSSAEITDLPVLPWVMAKGKAKTATGARGSYKVRTFNCARCGKLLQTGEASRDGPTGPFVCKGGCAEVAA